VCIYRAPSYTNADLDRDSNTFGKIVNELVKSGKDFYILGDFNLPKPKHLNYFTPILVRYNLKQLVTENTRKSSLLDLIITNRPDVASNVIVFNPHISDHCITEVTLCYKRPCFPQKTITYRDFKSIDPKALISELYNAPLKSSSSDLESIISEFNIEYLKVFDNHAPFVSKRIVMKPKRKTLSESTLLLKRERDTAYKVFKSTESDSDKEKFEELNKRVKRSIYSDTKEEMNLMIEKLGVYSAINSYCKFNRKRDNVIFDIDVNSINDYFVDISTKSHVTLNFPLKPSVLVSPTNKLILREIDMSEMFDAWNSLKKRSSTVYDVNNLCSRMFINYISCETVSNALLNIINTSIISGLVPSSLKQSKVIPLAKVKNPQFPSDLRPISIQPILGKLIEKVVYKQIVSFANDNFILNKCQFGFRSQHSTVHAQIALTDFLYSKIDEGYVCIVISLDLRKAFDKVDRELVLHKLSWYNIDKHWFLDYLSNRTQFVYHNNQTSRCRSTNLGVPQGSILGPFLFSLLINDLPYHVKEALTLLFADDTTLTIHGSPHDINNLLLKVSQCMEEVLKWMDTNNLELNLNKTQMIVVGSPRIVRALGPVSVTVRNITIKSSNVMKGLGLHIDSELNWAHHVNYITKRCNSQLWSLYPLQHMLSLPNMKLVINAYLMSKLRYMSVIWGTCNLKTKKQVERIVRRSARFVLSLHKYDKVKLRTTDELKWLFPHYLYQYELLKIAYGIFIGQCPQYFEGYLDYKFTTRNTRNKTYLWDKSNTSYGLKSFRHCAIALWLNLPVDMYQAESDFTSLTVFKKQLKLLYLEKQLEESIAKDDEHICNYSCIDSVVNYVLEDS